MSVEAEDNEITKLRRVMSPIHKEVLKFHDATQSSGDAENVDLVLNYKTKLKLKQDQIARLQNNLRTACTIAKTLTSAKSKEVTSLQSQLNEARDQYWALEQKYKQNTNLVATLKAENDTLRARLQSFVNFIEFGYKELQHICNEPLQDVSILKRLQKIVHCCCQYSANHENESKKCSILENKNKFMTSKIYILEKQLELISNELEIIRNNNNSRTQIQKGNVGAIPSKGEPSFRNITEREFSNHSKCNMKYLDLTRHLSSVKKLLHDQETLIHDLRCLSTELNLEYTINF